MFVLFISYLQACICIHSNEYSYKDISKLNKLRKHRFFIYKTELYRTYRKELKIDITPSATLISIDLKLEKPSKRKKLKKAKEV